MTSEGSVLIPRNYDSAGQLQMAEGHLDRHTPTGTPVDDLFLVHHYDQPDCSALRGITVVSADGKERIVTHDEIRSMPARKITALLECAGNGRGMLDRRAPGNQFGLGLFGQGDWTGVSLRDVLAKAELDESWTTAVVSALDEGITFPENSRDRFAKGLPREKALHPDTLLAWSFGNRSLADNHGGPLRLVVPGWYGIWWVKWPQRVELTSAPFSGFWQDKRYTYQSPDGAVLGVVAEQRPRAVLTSPRQGELVEDHTPLQILAWAGEHDVDAVEVSVDDGGTWLCALRVGDTGRWGWSRWTTSLPAGLPRGLRRIAVRATDSSGYSQDWQPPGNRLGYGNNGIQVTEVNLIASRPSESDL